MSRLFFAIALALTFIATAQPAKAISEFRNTVRIVGSSTVFPFAAFVAEKYHRKTGASSPVVESTGTGGGIKMFCNGTGVSTPDIVNASRRMTINEINRCADNKVVQITEIMIGWDGIILAQGQKSTSFNLTRKQLWKALAKRLPVDGQMVANPHTVWSHIDPSLPNISIQIFGPPPTSGTRDVFVERVMSYGCRGAQLIEKMDEQKRKLACGAIREDGVYIEAGEDDDLIVRRLDNNPDALGIMGYNALERRSRIIRALPINGILPGFETIRDGIYPLARPLFLYIKEEHLKALPEIQSYLNEFLSEAAIGEEGYLSDKGLIPLQDENGKSVKFRILKLTAE